MDTRYTPGITAQVIDHEIEFQQHRKIYSRSCCSVSKQMDNIGISGKRNQGHA